MVMIFKYLWYWIFFLRNPPEPRKKHEHLFGQWFVKGVLTDDDCDHIGDYWGIIIVARICRVCGDEEEIRYVTKSVSSQEEVDRVTAEYLENIRLTLNIPK